MIINDLITKGYFPEEMTPPFTTEDLAGVIDAILLQIDVFDPINRRGRKSSKPVTYSAPKIKAYRRNLAIPNPLHYIRLSKTIVDNWGAITAHSNNSAISLSKLNISPDSSRALLKPSFNKINREKILRSSGFRFLLKIDIAKCYRSIYTHSIPWALHTKAVSKGARGRAALYGNALDEDCRIMQDGQTVGIPIGPDSSRIISEIVLSAIDSEMAGLVPVFKGIRVIDDYHLYFRSLGDLELGRSVIHKSLKDYELELNQSKEKQAELPELIESEWFNVIREFRFRNKWNYQRTDLITYFDLVIIFTKKFPDDLVLTYAMSKLRFTVFSKKNWQIFQSLLLNALFVEPKILPYIAQNLISYKANGYRIDNALISQSLEEFIVYHHKLGNDFEVSWSLWIFKSLRIPISESTAQLLSGNMNPAVILTALDLHSMGLIPAGLDTTQWAMLLTANNLYSEFWIVAYEAKVKGWLPSPVDYIAAEPFFDLLRNANVSFYKPLRVLDLSKVKVNSADPYLANDEDEEEPDDVEADSVFHSVTPQDVPIVIPEFEDSDEDDIPF